MTTPPVFSHKSTLRHGTMPVSRVTPFTYRDGSTFLELLQGIMKYINDELFDQLGETLQDQALWLADEVQKIVDDQELFTTQINEMVHNFFVDVNESLKILNDQAISDLIDGEVSETYGSLIALIDSKIIPATLDQPVSELIANPSQSRTALDVVINDRSSYINVVEHGAIGDGEFDNHAIFSTIFDDARNNGKSVYIPAGSYYVDGELNISGLTVYGDLLGYENRNGTILIGNNADIMFNQQQTTVRHITQHISKIRFENVKTAVRLSYSVYSVLEDLYAIQTTGDSYLLGDNTIIGPLWNILNRVKGTSANGYGFVLGGKDWSNSNKFDSCFFAGSIGAFRITSEGGYGPIDNVFINTEFAGDGAGLVIDIPINGTTLDSCYFESKGPSILAYRGVRDLLIDGCIFGSVRNDVPGYTGRFIDIRTAVFDATIIGGWITTGGATYQDDLTFIEADSPANIQLHVLKLPSLSHVANPTFRFKPDDLNLADRRGGNLVIERRNQPSIYMQYADGSKPFRIYRNGTQGVADLGVVMQNDGETFLRVDPQNRVIFPNRFGTGASTATTTGVLGSIVRRLPISDEAGTHLGFIPIYSSIE